MGNVNVLPGKLNPRGYEQIAGAATAQSLTMPTGKKPRMALIQALTQNVRWRDDGTAPTTTVGYQLAAGSELAYSGDLEQIQFIEEAASTELNICYYD
jgi:hypothetical protein